MLSSPNLIEYFNVGQFAEAIAQLSAHGARLSRASASHPLFALFKKVETITREFRSASFLRPGLDQEELQVREKIRSAASAKLAAAAASLSAMFSLPDAQRLRPDFRLSSKQTAALGSNGIRSLTFGVPRSSPFGPDLIFENVCALGWHDGLSVCLAAGAEASPAKLVRAIIIAVQNGRQTMVLELLDLYSSSPGKITDLTQERQIAERILAMPGADGKFIAASMAHLSKVAIGSSLGRASGPNSDPAREKNILSWFSACPEEWAPLHQAIKKNYEDKLELIKKSEEGNVTELSSAWLNSAWVPLVRALAVHPAGHRHPALDAALASPDVAWWLSAGIVSSDTGKRLSVASDLVQGVLNKNGEIVRSFSTVFVALRCRAKLLKRLLEHGAALRVGSWPPGPGMSGQCISFTTELGDLASRNRPVSKSFLRRHKEWSAPALSTGRTALFNAPTPGVYSALVAAGLDPSIPDNDGYYAATTRLSMSSDHDEERSWSSICAGHLRAKIIPPDVKCWGAPISLLATKGSDLFRVWLKMSGSTPTAEQVASLLDGHHYLVVRDLVSKGFFDNDEKLQDDLWLGLIRQVERVYQSSKLKRANLLELFSAVSSRPNSPWPSTRTAWKIFWTTSKSEQVSAFGVNSATSFVFRASKGDFDFFAKYAAQLSLWSPQGGELSDYERTVLRGIAHKDPRFLSSAIPSNTSASSLTALFWDILKGSGGSFHILSAATDAAEELLKSHALLPNLGFVSLEEAKGKLAELKASLPPVALSSLAFLVSKVEQAVLECSTSAPIQVARLRI